MNSNTIQAPLGKASGQKSRPQNSEEAERLAVYEAWPKIPPKIRRAILLTIEATTEEELESE
jgi:hypothetical protein